MKTSATDIIIVGEKGFIVSQPKATVASFRVTWSEVAKVTAFKRDLITTDCICLALSLTGTAGVEVNEEMTGWTELIEALPKYLPGCAAPKEWLKQVTLPSFTLSATELFSRNHGKTNTGGTT